MTSHHRVLWPPAAGMLACLALGWCGLLLAQEPTPLFVVHTAQGANIAGPLQKLAEDWSMRLGGERPVLISGADVVSVRRQNFALPDFPERNVVLLAHGDRLPLDPQTPLMLDEGRLYVRMPGQTQEVRVPLPFVAVLWFQAPTGTADAGILMNKLLAATRAQDVVLLQNGDQVEGAVTGIDRTRGCRIEAGKRKLTVALGQIAAIAFNTELRVRLRPRTAFAHMVLRDGGRLSFYSLQFDSVTGRFKGKAFFGARLEIPLAEVVGLTPRQGQVVYLSDIEPAAYEHTPFFSTSWPLARDASIAGRSLRLAGNTFDKGLGMHSKSRVSYALDGRYRWFEALAGLDERSGRRGRVRLQVLVDGKEQALGRDKELTGADAPLAVRADVGKARLLTLVVDFGRFADVQAHVNWADARLLR